MSILSASGYNDIWPENLSPLYSCNRWIAWRPDDVRGKVPIDLKTGRPHNAGDPAIWMPHASTIEAAGRNVGFVLNGDGVCVVDFDTYKLGEGEQNGDRERGSHLWQQVIKYPLSYTEISPSGEGAHIVGYIDEETLARVGNFQLRLLGCIDILANRCYSTMTGNEILDSKYADISKLVNHILDEHARLGGRLQLHLSNAEHAAATSFLDRYAQRQNNELRGEALIDFVTQNVNKKFRARLNTVFQPGEHHRELAKLIGDMCKARCSRDAAYEVLAGSVFIKNSPIHMKSRETRERKLYRLMLRHEGDIRRNYWDKSVLSFERWAEDSQYHLEFGRAVVAQIDAARAGGIDYFPLQSGILPLKMPSDAERIEAAQAREKSTGIIKKRAFSAKVIKMHARIQVAIPEFECSLTPPPGVAGKIVNELGQMVTNPYLEYCVPSVLFGLSAFHGRRCKDNGDPIYVFSFVTGKLYTGKSRTAEALRAGVGSALAYYHANPADPTRTVASPRPSGDSIDLSSPIFEGKFKSPHEMHRRVQINNSHASLMDEAANAVRSFLDSTSLAIDFKSYVKTAWDAGQATKTLTPPMSKEGNRTGTQLAVYNPNLPIYATCTEDELADMNVKELVDGFWSRWIISFNEFECAPMLRKPETLRRAFSLELANMFRNWQSVAKELDDMYVPDSATEGATSAHEISYAKLVEIGNYLVNVKWSDEADALISRLSETLILIVSDAQRREGIFPKWFEILARSGAMTRRISCLLAASDNYLDPTVTAEHVKWAAEYVVYWASVLLTAHEDGKVAVSLDDGPALIVDKMRDCATGDRWVTEADLWTKCRYAFGQLAAKAGRGASARHIFGAAIVQLQTDGIVIRQRRAQGSKQSYEVPCVTANDLHKAWD